LLLISQGVTNLFVEQLPTTALGTEFQIASSKESIDGINLILVRDNSIFEYSLKDRTMALKGTGADAGGKMSINQSINHR
jgi:hypothetical protein